LNATAASASGTNNTASQRAARTQVMLRLRRASRSSRAAKASHPPSPLREAALNQQLGRAVMAGAAEIVPVANKGSGVDRSAENLHLAGAQADLDHVDDVVARSFQTCTTLGFGEEA
jgi:hypothetical protein